MADYERLSPDPEVFDEGREKQFLKKIRRFIAKIPFARTALAMFFALRDPDVPLAAKAPIAGALLYFVLPFDLIPDMILGAGFVDDAAVIATAFKAVQSIMQEKHYLQADAYLDELKRSV